MFPIPSYKSIRSYMLQNFRQKLIVFIMLLLVNHVLFIIARLYFIYAINTQTDSVSPTIIFYT